MASGNQVLQFTDIGQMYCRSFPDSPEYKTMSDSHSQLNPRLAGHGVSGNTSRQPGPVASVEQGGEFWTMLNHSMANLVQYRDSNTGSRRKSADKHGNVSTLPNTVAPPSNDSTNSPASYVSPMTSPLQFNSFIPLLPTATMMSSQPSRGPSAFPPLYSNVQQQLFTGMSSSVSPPAPNSFRNSIPSSASSSTVSPGSSSSAASSRHSSPGMSSSRDSGFSSPSPVNDATAETPIGCQKKSIDSENVLLDAAEDKENKAPKKGSKRTNFSSTQIAILQRLFDKNPYPDHEAMESIGNQVDMSEKQVKIWFQNKRARQRRRNAVNRNTSMVQTPRIYSPMMPFGYPSPVAMATTQGYTVPSSAPVYWPSGQGQASQTMQIQSEQARMYPSTSRLEPWKSYLPETSYGNWAPKANHFVPTQTTWHGALSY